LERLPGRYREVIVLCDLEDHTHEQAAQRLTLPVGTVKSRLARGREQLRIRLLRRGLAPAVGVLGAASSVQATAATVPVVLMDATARAAVRLAAGRAAAEVVSAAVAALLKESGRAIVMARSKMAATTILVFGFLATVAGVLAQQGARTAPPNPSPARVAGPATTPRNPKSDYRVEPPDLLMVQTREGLPGRPISGDRMVRPDGMVSLGYYGQVNVAGLTLDEVKAKIISRLRKHLTDEQLGLVRRDADGTLHRIPPAESDRVSVVVSTSNSKGYYVYEARALPRRFPLRDDATVLDALKHVGLTAASSASPKVVRLVRMPSSGLGRPYSLPVDFEAIVRGGDPATNHHLMSGDRIYVAEEPAPTVPSDSDGNRAAAGSDWERQLDEIEGQIHQVFKALASLQVATKPDSPRP
jgi:polysaccharide export outer membrane protein